MSSGVACWRASESVPSTSKRHSVRGKARAVVDMLKRVCEVSGSRGVDVLEGVFEGRRREEEVDPRTSHPLLINPISPFSHVPSRPYQPIKHRIAGYGIPWRAYMDRLAARGAMRLSAREGTAALEARDREGTRFEVESDTGLAVLTLLTSPPVSSGDFVAM